MYFRYLLRQHLLRGVTEHTSFHIGGEMFGVSVCTQPARAEDVLYVDRCFNLTNMGSMEACTSIYHMKYLVLHVLMPPIGDVAFYVLAEIVWNVDGGLVCVSWFLPGSAYRTLLAHFGYEFKNGVRYSDSFT